MLSLVIKPTSIYLAIIISSKLTIWQLDVNAFLRGFLKKHFTWSSLSDFYVHNFSIMFVTLIAHYMSSSKGSMHDLIYTLNSYCIVDFCFFLYNSSLFVPLKHVLIVLMFVYFDDIIVQAITHLSLRHWSWSYQRVYIEILWPLYLFHRFGNPFIPWGHIYILKIGWLTHKFLNAIVKPLLFPLKSNHLSIEKSLLIWLHIEGLLVHFNFFHLPRYCTCI